MGGEVDDVNSMWCLAAKWVRKKWPSHIFLELSPLLDELTSIRRVFFCYPNVVRLATLRCIFLFRFGLSASIDSGRPGFRLLVERYCIQFYLHISRFSLVEHSEDDSSTCYVDFCNFRDFLLRFLVCCKCKHDYVKWEPWMDFSDTMYV